MAGKSGATQWISSLASSLAVAAKTAAGAVDKPRLWITRGYKAMLAYILAVACGKLRKTKPPALREFRVAPAAGQ